MFYLILLSTFYFVLMNLRPLGLEYAYTTAPRSFQGIVLGLYSAIEGLGAFLGVLLVQITRSLQLGWIRSEIHFNQGHLDYFFYLLAVIQSAVVVVSGLVMYLRLGVILFFVFKMQSLDKRFFLVKMGTASPRCTS